MQRPASPSGRESRGHYLSGGCLGRGGGRRLAIRFEPKRRIVVRNPLASQTKSTVRDGGCAGDDLRRRRQPTFVAEVDENAD